MMRRNILMLMASRKKQELPYLCFTANSNNSSVRLNKAGTGTHNDISLKYSVNNGKTWTLYGWDDLSDQNLGTEITLTHAGDKVYFKAGKKNDFFSSGSSAYYNFAMSGSISASGNIMSLVAEDMPDDIPSAYYFYGMFRNCTALVNAPTLPATSMTQQCYYSMFQGCTALVNAPVLPAITLSRYCYCNMFRDCSSLSFTPALPATTLDIQCYYNMFLNCTSLSGVAEIKATSIVFTGSMRAMFKGCTSLDGIKVHFTNWDSTSGSNSATYEWLPNNQGAVFHCPSALNTSVAGSTSTIPSDWTIEKDVND